MSEHVEVRRIGSLEYGATVHDGQDTTHHRVTISPAFLDDLLVPDVDEARVAEETIRYLLDRETGDAIPAHVDLDHLSHRDDGFVGELRMRLTN
jgi:hypothetical protein